MSTVVVLDDDPVVRRSIALALRREGHQVLEFEDAAPALESVDFSEVNLVVTDLRMPTLGDQLVLILRERGVEVPVIVVSGYLDKDRTRYLKDLGVHRFISKPFELSDLLSAVNEMLSR